MVILCRRADYKKTSIQASHYHISEIKTNESRPQEFLLAQEKKNSKTNQIYKNVSTKSKKPRTKSYMYMYKMKQNKYANRPIPYGLIW
jgi:hypothetical protein